MRFCEGKGVFHRIYATRRWENLDILRGCTVFSRYHPHSKHLMATFETRVSFVRSMEPPADPRVRLRQAPTRTSDKEDLQKAGSLKQGTGYLGTAQ